MRQSYSTISRDIVMDGAAIDVGHIVAELAVFINMDSGSVDVEVSADGTTFVVAAAAVTGQSTISLPVCQSLRIVDGTSGVPASLQWNGVLR